MRAGFGQVCSALLLIDTNQFDKADSRAWGR